MDDSVILQHASTSTTDFLIYTGNFCGYCVALKRLLNNKGLTFTELNFDQHKGLREAVVQETGHRTVPVVIDLRSDPPMFVGGFDETKSMLR